MFYAGGGITEAGLKVKNITHGFIRQKTIERPTKMVLYPQNMQTLQLLLTAPQEHFTQPGRDAFSGAAPHAVPNLVLNNAAFNNPLYSGFDQGDRFEYVDEPEGYDELFTNSNISPSRNTASLKSYLKTFFPQIDGELLLNHYRSTQEIHNHGTNPRIDYSSPAICITGPLQGSYQSGEVFNGIVGYVRGTEKSLDTGYTLPNGITQEWANLATAFVLPGKSATQAGNVGRVKKELVDVVGTTSNFNGETIEVLTGDDFVSVFGVSLPRSTGARPFIFNLIESVRRPLEPRDIFWLQPGQVIRNCTCQLFEYDFS